MNRKSQRDKLEKKNQIEILNLKITMSNEKFTGEPQQQM